MIIPLHNLGTRIMIIGTSCAGKSTLAHRLEGRLGVPAIYLDQLRFYPGTDWQKRPDEEFHALHAEAIENSSWIIEGDYSSLVPARVDRATAIIFLSASPLTRFSRYLKRTFAEQETRAGQLDGAREVLHWDMIDWVLRRSAKRAEQTAVIVRASGKPMVEVRTKQQLRALYSAWGLTPTI